MTSESDSDLKAMLEAFSDPDAREALDRFVLLNALGAALERAGHVRLVQATAEDAGSSFGGLIALLVFWGLGASIGVVLDTSVVAWIGLSVAVLIAFGIVSTAVKAFAQPLVALMTLGWIAVAVALAISQPEALIWTHGLPALLVLMAGLALRNLRLREARDVAFALAGVVRSAPYVAPVVIVVVILPALTADVWRLAGAADAGHLIAAAGLSVGILWILVTRQLRREVGPALASRCRWLAARAATPDETRSALVDAAEGDDAKAVGELPDEVLASSWPPYADEYAPYLTAVAGEALRRPLGARMLVTAAGVGLMLAAYIYVLLAATVPTDVAASWAQTDIPTTQVAVVVGSVTVPGGAYLAIAALLGVFATAIFLAFAVTEERVAASLTEALLREPIDHFLLLAVPFTNLIEWWLARQGEDYESEDGESDDAAGSSPASGSGDANS